MQVTTEQGQCGEVLDVGAAARIPSTVRSIKATGEDIIVAAVGMIVCG